MRVRCAAAQKRCALGNSAENLRCAGDLPQNVNFAIRGEVMRRFLETHQVNFSVSHNTAKLENNDIAAQSAAVTVRVR